MTNVNDGFDPIEAEKREAETLIERGLYFLTPKRSIFKYFSRKKERNWEIKPPYLGTLLYINREFVDIKFNEERYQENPLNEVKLAASLNPDRLAKIVAIAVLNNRLGIKYLSPLLALYFKWRVTPANLLKLSKILIEVQNYGDFIDSIRYLHAMNVTAPIRIEEKKQA